MSAGTLEKLVRDLSPGLVAYVWRLCGDGHASQDIVQEAFVRFLKNRERVENPAPWLYRVCRNLAFRRMGRRDWDVSVDSAGLDMCESPEPPCTLALEGRELMERVFEALGQMNPRDAEILDLKYFGELSYREIAGVLGISESNVGVRLNRAMLALRSRLRASGFFEGERC